MILQSSWHGSQSAGRNHCCIYHGLGSVAYKTCIHSTCQHHSQLSCGAHGFSNKLQHYSRSAARGKIVQRYAVCRASSSAHDAQEQEFRELFCQLKELSKRQLRQKAALQPAVLSASFLFWLQDLERTTKSGKPHKWLVKKSAAVSETSSQQGIGNPTGPAGFVMLSSIPSETATQPRHDLGSTAKEGPTTNASQSQPMPQNSKADNNDLTAVDVTPEDVARLASQLVEMRMIQDQEAACHMLPPLASSVAYDNLARWKKSTGISSDAVSVPGVPQLPLEQLYRISEKQEQDLLQGTSSWARNPDMTSDSMTSVRANKPKSSVDDFARRPGNETFAGIAAQAMARMRAKFMGYNDEAKAAEHVLNTMLWHAGDIGEMAELLHTACTPPGLAYIPPPHHKTPTQNPQPTQQQGRATGRAEGDTRQHDVRSLGNPSSSQSLRDDGGNVLGGAKNSFLAGNATGSDSSGYGSHLGAFSRSTAGYSNLKQSLPGIASSDNRGSQGKSQSSYSSSTGRGDIQQEEEEGPAEGQLFCTTPQALKQVINQRLNQVQAQGSSPDASAQSLDSTVVQANVDSQLQADGNSIVLPCGMLMTHALHELLPIIDEYESNVWAREHQT